MAASLLQPPVQNPLLGISARLSATLCFAVMAAMIKLAHEAQISLPEIAFYRFAFGLPPLVVWMAATRNFGAWRTRRPLAHISRAVIGLATMVMAFSALGYLPLAEATTISFAAPLFSVMLSALVLAEPVGRHRWSAVGFGLLGVIIVMQPGGSALSPLGLALAVGAALGVAGVTVAIRQIGRTESTPTTVLWFTALSTAALGMLMPFYGENHTPQEWLILAVLGLAGGIGQLGLTASLRFAPVAVVAPLDYSQLLWVVLLGWLIWSTQPAATTWAGAAVIIASGLYTLYREHRLGREKPHRAALDG